MTASTPLMTRAAAYEALADALAACPSTVEQSPERSALMAAIWETVCTQRSRTVKPMGSVGAVLISSEYAAVELIAVMDWLVLHETEARALDPDGLFRTMRAVGTLGMNGSGRAARADKLRGITHVPATATVQWTDLGER